ncbi:MAG TPA: glycosyltransferase family 2 protein, partial [Bacteroidia bacterium]|nr:glycosyltransferase family 2 protein [Bacteroidia bacterium]
IGSVLAQHFRDFEFIIVDGGSGDGTKEYLSQQPENRMKWISEKDAGIYDAQNKGIGMARGEYCLLLNSGDCLLNAYVLSEVFDKIDPQADIAYGDVMLFDKRGMYGKKIHPQRMSSYYLMKEVVAHQGQFIRRNLFLEFGGYNLAYEITADYEFFARMFWKQKVKLHYLNMVVSVFDTEGLSSDPAQKKRIGTERRTIQAALAPVFWYYLYYGYAWLSKFIGR